MTAGWMYALAATGTPLRTGDVHVVAHVHPAALDQIALATLDQIKAAAAENLAKHRAVPSVKDVETALFTHAEMRAAMEAAGDYGYPTPSHEPPEAAVLVAYYRTPQNRARDTEGATDA